jgi:hypothetical protein
MEITPSKVREQVMAAHGSLRDAMAKVAILVRRTQGGEPTAELLRVEASRLLEFLHSHIEMENLVLEPVLRTIDAWGPERAARLRSDHAAQQRPSRVSSRS